MVREFEFNRYTFTSRYMYIHVHVHELYVSDVMKEMCYVTII